MLEQAAALPIGLKSATSLTNVPMIADLPPSYNDIMADIVPTGPLGGGAATQQRDAVNRERFVPFTSGVTFAACHMTYFTCVLACILVTCLISGCVLFIVWALHGPSRRSA
jgi:hypothetical protein